jgi:hypothetical protein
MSLTSTTTAESLTIEEIWEAGRTGEQDKAAVTPVK